MSEGKAVVRRAAQRSRMSARWWRGERDQMPDWKVLWARRRVSFTSWGEAEWQWVNIVPVEGSSIGMLQEIL